MTTEHRRPRILTLVLLGAALAFGGATTLIVAAGPSSPSIDAESLALPASSAVTSTRRDIRPVLLAVAGAGSLTALLAADARPRRRHTLPLRVDLRDPGRRANARRGPPA